MLLIVELKMPNSKTDARARRKIRIRKGMQGTTERPRLSIFRSSRHIYAQVIDDTCNQVLVAAGTVSKADAEACAGKKKGEKAKYVGAKVAELCKSKGITMVIFDRNGFRYHGRVKALADAAREKGLIF